MRKIFIVLVSCLLTLAPEVAANPRPGPVGTKYQPQIQRCPAGTSLVRNVGIDPARQRLSDDEQRYVLRRRRNVLPEAFAQYFKNVQANFNKVQVPNKGELPPYLRQILQGRFWPRRQPTIGIATSGGAYRSALFGAAAMDVLDGRNNASVATGTGGLLQAVTYTAGLSGGGWLVSSMAQANFPTISELVFGPAAPEKGGFGGWQTEVDVLQPTTNSMLNEQYVAGLLAQLAVKASAGFPVTITDLWGLGLGLHFANGTTPDDIIQTFSDHSAGILFSAIQNVPTFKHVTQPFPILTSDLFIDQLLSPTVIVPLTNPIIEFNPFETGSYDPTLAAFTPTKFLGSPPGGQVCVTNFDQVALIEGTTSTVFNVLNLTAGNFPGTAGDDAVAAAATLTQGITELIAEKFGQFPQQQNIHLDSAVIPNPFVGVLPQAFPGTNEAFLTLEDGGEAGENLPFQPLLVHGRHVDTIIALDASSNTLDNFANGTSLLVSAARVGIFSDSYSFPPVVGLDVIQKNKLDQRPTFFGCNSPAGSKDPLIIYIANGGAPLGQAPVTNSSTFQLNFKKEEVQAILAQVTDIMTQGIPQPPRGGSSGALEKDPLWPTCLACAVVDRTRRDLGIKREGVCSDCLNRYCAT